MAYPYNNYAVGTPEYEFFSTLYNLFSKAKIERNKNSAIALMYVVQQTIFEVHGVNTGTHPISGSYSGDAELVSLIMGNKFTEFWIRYTYLSEDCTLNARTKEYIIKWWEYLKSCKDVKIIDGITLKN